MSILGLSNSHSINNKMNTISLLELRKQAYFYIKEKIRTARLALTDVTPAQLLTEEATNGNPWAPDPRTLALISRSAFEIEDYWRIVDILHQKLAKFDRKNWREFYNALVVLEHLVTHGPKSVAEEFQTEVSIIMDMENFHHVDEKGFNWGLTLRKKSERVLKLLEKGPILEEEREHARKLTREIKGFGSFSGMPLPTTYFKESSAAFGRCHSQFNLHGNGGNLFESNGDSKPGFVYLHDDVKADQKSKIMKRSLKKNKTARDLHNNNAERESLLWEITEEVLIQEEDHPFNDTEKQTRLSLLAAKKKD